MKFGDFTYPIPVNEPVLNYAPGSPEKKRLKQVLAELKAQQIDVPMYIGNKEVRTNNKVPMHPPHEVKHTLGHFNAGEEKHVQQAIEAALAAKRQLGKYNLAKPSQYIFKSSRFNCHQIQAVHERYHHAWAKQKCLSSRN
jgi:hypothetical protein